MTATRTGWLRRAEITLWVMVAAALLFRALPPREIGRVAWDAPAPDFSLRSLEGERIGLGRMEGQVVLVDFWATWCPPCRQEMPGFQAVYDDYRARGFSVVGVAMDVGGPALVEALPRSFLVDRQGRMRRRVSGVFSEGTLRQAVEELLAEEAS
ncbi:MAG TPA: TlpA disulfide reductase family protein [Longimicrobiales bacterium]|nr:TlpA disulfide reductase family protein [Longimicrobiales bacterium]